MFQRLFQALARRAKRRARSARQSVTLQLEQEHRQAETRARRRHRMRRLAQKRAAQRASDPANSAGRRRPARVVLAVWVPTTLAGIAALSLAGNILQYFHYSPARTLVKVGARAVPQREYMADLDATAGRAVLGHIVYGELVRQAALRAGVFPTPSQVDARLAAMPGEGARNAPARDAVALQLALENLRLVGTTATDAEVEAFYAAHKAQLAAPPRVTASLIVTRSAADAAQAAHLLAAGKTDAQIAALPRTQAAGVGGFAVHVQALPPALRARLQQMVFAAPLGAIGTLALPDGAFLTVQAHSRSGGAAPPLAQAHDAIARLVRLQKAPSAGAELAALYHASPPTFEMSRYAQYLSDAPASVAAGPRTAEAH